MKNIQEITKNNSRGRLSMVTCYDYTFAKIISKTKMRKLKPNYLFVLIWSFRSEVIKQEKKFLLKGGKLVFPLPIFHIVDKNNYKYFMNEKLGAFGFDI